MTTKRSDRETTSDAEKARDEEAKHLDERIDEESRESFPASDPPSSTPVQGIGPPPKEPRQKP